MQHRFKVLKVLKKNLLKTSRNYGTLQEMTDESYELGAEERIEWPEQIFPEEVCGTSGTETKWIDVRVNSKFEKLNTYVRNYFEVRIEDFIDLGRFLSRKKNYRGRIPQARNFL